MVVLICVHIYCPVRALEQMVGEIRLHKSVSISGKKPMLLGRILPFIYSVNDLAQLINTHS